MSLTDPRTLPKALKAAIDRAYATSVEEDCRVPVPAHRTYEMYLNEAFGTDEQLLEIMLNASLRMSSDAKQRLQVLSEKSPSAISMNIHDALEQTLAEKEDGS